MGGATERDRIEVNAFEMARRLVLFSITDGAKRMLGFKRCLPERIPGEREGGVDKISPVRVAPIVLGRSMIERQSHALERDETIGELVLDRLKTTYGLTELMPIFGIINRQFERPASGAMRSRHQSEFGTEEKIVNCGA